MVVREFSSTRSGMRILPQRVGLDFGGGPHTRALWHDLLSSIAQIVDTKTYQVEEELNCREQTINWMSLSRE